MIKGVLFDFDGTIVDSERSRFESINKTLERYNIKISKNDWNKKYLRLNTRPIFEQILKENNIDADSNLLYDESHKLREKIIINGGVDIIPNFFEFYNFLKKQNIKMIICSGGKKEFMELILKKINLKDILYFGRESYDNVKPAPDAYLKGLEILNLMPEEVLVFDDSYNGLLSAKNAKIDKIISINSVNKKVDELKLYLKIKNYCDFDFEKILEINEILIKN